MAKAAMSLNWRITYWQNEANNVEPNSVSITQQIRQIEGVAG